VISAKGIGKDPDKVRAVEDFPEPDPTATKAKRVKHIQSFIGMAGWYRRMIPNFSIIAKPLTDLTKKRIDFNWGKTEMASFKNIKTALVNSAESAFPNYRLPMRIYTDACLYGIAGCLTQQQEGEEGPERPLAYVSRLVTKAESSFCVSELEMPAAVWTIKKLRHIIWDCNIILFTDHIALTWLLTKKDLSGRLLRWALCLGEYDIEIRYKNGKSQIHVDSFSRYPSNEPDPDENAYSIMALAASSEEKISDLEDQKEDHQSKNLDEK
jgi:hypothetical protein